MKEAIKSAIGAVFVQGIRKFLKRPMERETAPIDLTLMAQFVASYKSAEFLIEHMVKAKNCYDQLGLLDFALDEAKLDGPCLEFGVYKGVTINHISQKAKRVYGFDSFEGTPEQWRFDVNMRFFRHEGPVTEGLRQC